MGVDTAATPGAAEADGADTRWMQHALELAESLAATDIEVPVVAVIVDESGVLVAAGENRMLRNCDPSAHAEIVALRSAGQRLRNYRMPGCSLYVTLEPCAMCAIAMVHARIARVVFAAADPKTGALGGSFNVLSAARHNHRLQVQGGLMAEPAGDLLRRFFQRRRAAPTAAGGLETR